MPTTDAMLMIEPPSCAVLRDAGVVDHDVDLAEVRDYGLHARIDLGRDRDVDAVALGLDAKRLKRLHCLVAPFGLEVAYRDVCAALGELLCDGRADSACSACDDCDFALQVVHSKYQLVVSGYQFFNSD